MLDYIYIIQCFKNKLFFFFTVNMYVINIILRNKFLRMSFHTKDHTKELASTNKLRSINLKEPNLCLVNLKPSSSL